MGSFLEWILESSILILLILGIRKIFMGKIRYAGIYALWLVVLLRFMIPVNFISTPFSVGNIISNRVSDWSAAEQTEQTEQKIETSNLGEAGQQPDRETGQVWNSGSSWENAGKFPVRQNGYNSLESENTERNTFQEFVQNLKGVNGKLILGIGWLIISALLLLWFVLSNICLLQRLKQNRRFYGKRDSVKIYTVSGIQNPCLYGFFRPVIYIPKFLVYGEECVRADKEEMEQIITHEYVHYRHRDHIWAMARMLLASVYWFHPFVWLAVSCSKKDAELFCDETAIQLLGEERRFCYGRMLVRLASDAKWGDFRYPILSMSRKGKEMERRIRAISVKKCYSRWVLIPLIVVVLATAGITCSTGVKPSAKGNETEEPMQSESSVGEEKEQQKDKAGQLFQLGMKEQLPVYSNFFQTYTGDSKDSFVRTGKDKGYYTSSFYVSSLEKVFQDYINIFTESVNTGNTDQMYQVLAIDSDVYRQQCNLVKNYYKRGIHEEVKACSITALDTVAPNQVKINSKEKIKVYYGNDTSKIVKQKYQYTCEFRNGGWFITDMKDILL